MAMSFAVRCKRAAAAGSTKLQKTNLTPPLPPRTPPGPDRGGGRQYVALTSAPEHFGSTLMYRVRLCSNPSFFCGAVHGEWAASGIERHP